MGQVGASLSGGEDELAKGKATRGRNQNAEITDLGKEWELGGKWDWG